MFSQKSLINIYANLRYCSSNKFLMTKIRYGENILFVNTLTNIFLKSSIINVINLIKNLIIIYIIM